MASKFFLACRAFDRFIISRKRGDTSFLIILIVVSYSCDITYIDFIKRAKSDKVPRFRAIFHSCTCPPFTFINDALEGLSWFDRKRCHVPSCRILVYKEAPRPCPWQCPFKSWYCSAVMDYKEKGTDWYKEEQARQTLEVSRNGDCTKIPSSLPPKYKGKDIFDGATGISVAGTQTNIALPALGVTLDAGRNVDKVLERNLLISHYDADHVEGVGRAICNAINRKSVLDIFLPSMDEHPQMKSAITKFMRNDTDHLVTLHEMVDGETASAGNASVTAFKVVHSPESLGYVYSMRGKDGKRREIAYTGDVDMGRMKIGPDHPLRNVETIIIDGTYSGIFSMITPIMDIFTNHTSTGEIEAFSKGDKKLKNLGIMHLPPFSACFDLKNDIKTRMGSGKKNVYLLDSCSRDLFDSPLDRMSSFKKVL